MTIFKKNKLYFSPSRWWLNEVHIWPCTFFLTLWSHSVLLRICQHTKSNLMIYNLSMLKKINFSSSLLTLNVKYFYSVWFSDHGLLVKNNQHLKTFQMLYDMAMFRKKNVLTYQLWRHNILHLTWCRIFLAFWSRSFLLKIKNTLRAT